MARQNRASGSPKSNERFSTVPGSSVPRSAFDRSFSHKTTMKVGLLCPLFVDEVLPGDTINLTPAFFVRLSTPFKPYMDGLHFDWQFFYCPTRLVWDNFVKMMGEQKAPADHIDYTVPQIPSPAISGWVSGSMGDYFGLPTAIPDLNTSALPFRIYNKIFSEWYRDENIQTGFMDITDDGPDNPIQYGLLRRGKRKDYLTGALPFAQKGDPVTFPIVGNADVIRTGLTAVPDFESTGDAGVQRQLNADGTSVVQWGTAGVPEVTPAGLLSWGTDVALEVDFSTTTLATINDMRVAIGVQHLLERDARGGTRYRELILSHFGVHTDDIRLMRPELLCTGSMQINPNAIAQTVSFSQGNNEGQLGELGAFATGQSVGRGFNRTFQEHGWIMGICSVRADLTYQQGLNRMFTRETRYDHFWPDLANLGEQAVLSREIYTDGTGTASVGDGDFLVWGYQPRYEEYRHRQSFVSGDFRSNATLPLDVWHLALDFSTRPTLDAVFIEENPPIDRVIILSEAEGPSLLVDAFFKIKHVRPMPKFAVPGMVRF